MKLGNIIFSYSTFIILTIAWGVWVYSQPPPPFEKAMELLSGLGFFGFVVVLYQFSMDRFEWESLHRVVMEWAKKQNNGNAGA
jgi:hypothetical protein